MDNATLRRACEVTGMAFREHPRWHVLGPGGVTLWFDIPNHRDWIESRCASLLVAKVRERDHDTQVRFYMLLPGPALATDSKRMAAALEVVE